MSIWTACVPACHFPTKIRCEKRRTEWRESKKQSQLENCMHERYMITIPDAWVVVIIRLSCVEFDDMSVQVCQANCSKNSSWNKDKERGYIAQDMYATRKSFTFPLCAYFLFYFFRTTNYVCKIEEGEKERKKGRSGSSKGFLLSF
jgi:hypothetical protein